MRLLVLVSFIAACLWRVLQIDPDERITIDEALEHPWVREGGIATEKSLEKTVLSGVRAVTKVERAVVWPANF